VDLPQLRDVPVSSKVVMMDGKLMDADALRAAGGFEGRPKYAD
jgi:hypothetical protein